MTVDLDALAYEGEDAAPFEFTWAGETYTMPSYAQLPWTTVAKIFEGSSVEERLRLVLGDEQFERFAAKPCPAGKLMPLFDAYMGHQGVTMGES